MSGMSFMGSRKEVQKNSGVGNGRGASVSFSKDSGRQ